MYRHQQSKHPYVVALLLLGSAVHGQTPGGETQQPPSNESAPVEEQSPAQTQEVAPGQVQGRVFDGIGGAPMAGVFVEAEGTEYQTVTDTKGIFLLTLPPGSYTLQIAAESFVPQKRPVTVFSQKTLTLTQSVRLRPMQERSQVHVIREPDRNTEEAQNLVRKQSARVTDIVSSEEIKKSGDSSASQAASRVVGATIVGDRFVYVRGLGDRYGNALFNGAPLPSPEPDRQAVPFDIFPASLLANLTVVKSATADIPADFAGGSVQINTKEFPSKLTINLSASLGFNLNTAFQPLLSGPVGRLDWLGFDDGQRARPPLPIGAGPGTQIGILRPKLPEVGGRFSGAEVAAFARSFENTWQLQRQPLGPPNYAISGSLGNRGHLFGKPVGYLLSLTYDADAQARSEEVRTFVIDRPGAPLSQRVDYQGERGTRSVQWGGLANLAMDVAPGHRLSASGIFTQNADSEARLYEGYNFDRQTDVWSSRMRFVQRTFGFAQVGGSHHKDKVGKLSDADLEWRLTYAFAGRNEPDLREAFYEKLGGSYRFFNQGNSGQRFFSENGEHVLAGGLDYTQSFKQWSGLGSRFKLGTLLRYRDRSFSATRYQFALAGLSKDGRDLGGLPPAQIFDPANLSDTANQGVVLVENTLGSDSYRGNMGVYAGYALLDLALSSHIRAVVGARLEASLQNLDGLDAQGQPVSVRLNNVDVLPSLNLVFRLRDEMNLRAGASMTVARPEFRELAPFQFAEFFGGELVQGNPELSRTRIVNTDLRWEWFFGPKDLLALSAFYKYFDSPIESIIYVSGDLIRSFKNASSAHNAGVELEVRKNLGFITKHLETLALGGNLSYIYSSVDLRGQEGIQTSLERPLQGQSPYVINAFVSFEKESWGTQARLTYNVFGPRIDSVGALGLPDRYEQPRHMLDLSVTQRLGKGLSLRLSGRNLLDSPVWVTQGDQITSRFRTGRVLAASLSYSY